MGIDQRGIGGREMKDKDKLLKIVSVMEADGWDAVLCDFGSNSADFRKGYAQVTVSFEECLCHGGRITVSEKNHTNQYYIIQHACYDTEKGIVDSETELLWEIDNELLPVVKQFGHYSYAACIVNRYGKKDGHDVEETRYYTTLDDAFRSITDNAIDADPLTFTEGVRDYPNPKCHLKVTRIKNPRDRSEERNKLWFELEYTDNDWKTSRKYNAYLLMFDKMK